MPGLLHGVDQPHKLLGCVGDRYIVVLALGSLFGEVCGKSRIPDADVLGGVENGIAKVSGTSFLHEGVTVGKMARLVC